MPLIAGLEQWLSHHSACVAPKSPLGEALKYIARYWDGLSHFLSDGRVELDNNSVERTIRPIALNRKNALFAGLTQALRNWATIASLIETCKLNAIDPQVYLTATLTAIVNGHKQSRIDDLLPRNYRSGLLRVIETPLTESPAARSITESHSVRPEGPTPPRGPLWIRPDLVPQPGQAIAMLSGRTVMSVASDLLVAPSADLNEAAVTLGIRRTS